MYELPGRKGNRSKRLGFLTFKAVLNDFPLYPVTVGNASAFPYSAEKDTPYFAETLLDPRAFNFAFFCEKGAAGLLKQDTQRFDPAPVQLTFLRILGKVTHRCRE